MNIRKDAESEDRLTDALERLTNIQKSVVNLNQEANQIRRYIKDFDVNVDALNVLASVRSKDQQGDGSQILEDVTKYAHLAGIQIELSEPKQCQYRNGDQNQHGSQVRVEYTQQEMFSDSFKLLTQLIIATVITAGLFTLIH